MSSKERYRSGIEEGTLTCAVERCHQEMGSSRLPLHPPRSYYSSTFYVQTLSYLPVFLDSIRVKHVSPPRLVHFIYLKTIFHTLQMNWPKSFVCTLSARYLESLVTKNLINEEGNLCANSMKIEWVRLLGQPVTCDGLAAEALKIFWESPYHLPFSLKINKLIKRLVTSKFVGSTCGSWLAGCRIRKISEKRKVTIFISMPIWWIHLWDTQINNLKEVLFMFSNL